MTAALEGSEWSAARPGRTLPPGKAGYSFYRRLGEPLDRSGRAEILVPTGIRSRTVQPIVSHYTDWATRPHVRMYVYNGCNVGADGVTWIRSGAWLCLVDTYRQTCLLHFRFGSVWNKGEPQAIRNFQDNQEEIEIILVCQHMAVQMMQVYLVETRNTKKVQSRKAQEILLSKGSWFKNTCWDITAVNEKIKM